MYVIHELGAFISAYRKNNDRYVEIEQYPLYESSSEGVTGSEIHIHPNGKYLYATSRGNNLVHKFDIDLLSGELTFDQSIASGGKTPISFDISENGPNLVVCNQHSHCVSLFSIGQRFGLLLPKMTAHVEHPIMVSCAKRTSKS